MLEQDARLLDVAEQRFDAAEVMCDRSPICAASAEAVEHDVAIGVRMEVTREHARTAAIAECRGGVCEHRDRCLLYTSPSPRD